MKRAYSQQHAYFIHHNFSGTLSRSLCELTDNRKKNSIIGRAVEMLYNDQLIAIRFTAETFHRWNDYSSKAKTPLFKETWDCFEELRQNGGIVLAQYLPNQYIIGTVRKGSCLQFVSDEVAPDFRGLKALAFDVDEKIRSIKYGECPFISSIISLTDSPISRIPAGGPYLMNLCGKTRRMLSPDVMHPNVREFMCVEWLRSKYCPKQFQLHHLLADIGQTMESVDILGRTVSGKTLYGRVVHDKNAKLGDEHADLMHVSGYGTDSVRIWFTNGHSCPDSIKNHCIPLSRVWSDLKRDKQYKNMLWEMSGVMQGS